jgi:putative membrane protein
MQKVRVMLWIKSFHLISIVVWFSGIFYLPRLFVYHSMAEDKISIERFKIMERKLYYGITTPGMVLTLIFGIWLLILMPFYLKTGWMLLKLSLIGLLIIYHFYCGYLVKIFKENRNSHSHIFYRWLNELPVIILVGAVILAVVKPF